MRILLVYFSWTGNTRAVAEEVRRTLAHRNVVEVCELQPRRRRRYIEWLLLSVIPALKVEIQPVVADLSGYDLVVIGCPKWSFNCPPVNEYIGRVRGSAGRVAAVFITYGGFGEKRYLSRLVKALEKKGMRVSATLTVRRRNVANGEYREGVKSFCRDIEQIVDEKMLMEAS